LLQNGMLHFVSLKVAKTREEQNGLSKGRDFDNIGKIWPKK